MFVTFLKPILSPNNSLSIWEHFCKLRRWSCSYQLGPFQCETIILIKVPANWWTIASIVCPSKTSKQSRNPVREMLWLASQRCLRHLFFAFIQVHISSWKWEKTFAFVFGVERRMTAWFLNPIDPLSRRTPKLRCFCLMVKGVLLTNKSTTFTTFLWDFVLLSSRTLGR